MNIGTIISRPLKFWDDTPFVYPFIALVAVFFSGYQMRHLFEKPPKAQFFQHVSGHFLERSRRSDPYIFDTVNGHTLPIYCEVTVTRAFYCLPDNYYMFKGPINIEIGLFKAEAPASYRRVLVSAEDPQSGPLALAPFSQRLQIGYGVPPILLPIPIILGLLVLLSLIGCVSKLCGWAVRSRRSQRALRPGL